MIRALVWGIIASLAAVGCAAVDLLPTIDPPCRDRQDAVDCQAALDAAIPDLGTIDGFTVTVEPITCRADGCTTWVNATPPEGECLPHGGVELHRPMAGGWTVISQTHGDPPCAFE